MACQSGIARLANPGQSSDFICDHSSLDAHAHRAVALFVQIAYARQESLLFVARQARHAVHVVVAVALDMRQPEQRDQREVLLQREPGLDGEVLAGHEVAARPIPLQRAALISDLYRPLQVFDETPR